MAIKIISILLFSLSVGNCHSVSISEVEKKIIPSGQPNQPIVIQYSATVTVTGTIIVNSVEIEGSSLKLGIVFYRLPDGLVISPENRLEPGKYYVKATAAYKNELATTDDKLIFSIENTGQQRVSITKTTTFKKH